MREMAAQGGKKKKKKKDEEELDPAKYYENRIKAIDALSAGSDGKVTAYPHKFNVTMSGEYVPQLPGLTPEQDDMIGEVDHSPVQVVIPVDPVEVAGIGGVAIHTRERLPNALGDSRRVGHLAEGGQRNALGAEAFDASPVADFIDDAGGQAEPGRVEGRGIEVDGLKRADAHV